MPPWCQDAGQRPPAGPGAQAIGAERARAQRYDKTSGLGTLISMMLPYTIVLLIAWTLFFVAWYLIGIPLGPAWAVHL